MKKWLLTLCVLLGCLQESTMALDIVVWNQKPDHILKQRSKDVAFPLSHEDQTFIRDMKEKIVSLGGVGLASNQVGILKRVIAIYIPHEVQAIRKDVVPCEAWVAINPSYEPYHAAEQPMVKDFEGCYSLPDICGEVPRHPEILVRYMNEQGEHIERRAQGFEARVLQHEIDHIDGILFLDRMTPGCWRGTVEEMQKLRRSRMSPDEQQVYDAMLDEHHEEQKQETESL